MMTYQESMAFIHSVEWQGSRPGLSRITELLARLGNPEKDIKVIHVAGTNGKGSFCAMLESVLRHAGYRTGLFVSPYLEQFEERIQADGSLIDSQELAAIVSEIAPHCRAMSDLPTEFEILTAIGFTYFKKKKVDLAVVECGMGGRLDSTNVIPHPLLSVITGISLDHTQFLGDTIEKIAAEKAGIQPKDIIVELGGYTIKNVNGLTRALRNFKAGDTTTIVVFRSGKEMVLSITLDAKPEEAATEATVTTP